MMLGRWAFSAPCSEEASAVTSKTSEQATIDFKISLMTITFYKRVSRSINSCFIFSVAWQSSLLARWSWEAILRALR